MGNALEARKHVEEGAHVGGLFLNPDDFARVGMSSNRRGDFVFGQRIKLVEEENRSGGVVPAAAFCAKFVADFSAGDQDTLRVGDFGIGNKSKEARAFEFFNRGDWRPDGAACSWE